MGKKCSFCGKWSDTKLGIIMNKIKYGVGDNQNHSLYLNNASIQSMFYRHTYISAWYTMKMSLKLRKF